MKTSPFRYHDTIPGISRNHSHTMGYFTPIKEILQPPPDEEDRLHGSSSITIVTDLEKSELLQGMTVVKEGEVYGLLPSTLYGEEHEADLINAYRVGKALYPDKFLDVDPEVMADYIYSFLYGQPLFEEMDRALGGMALSRIPLFP